MLAPLAAAVLIIVAADQASQSASAQAGGSVPAPSAALATLDTVDIGGHRWTNEDLRGRVVLLDFWATWCAPCLAELPRLKTLRNRHDRRDFEILGISLDAVSRQTLVSWLNRNRIEWPQVHERGGYSGETARKFGIDRLPRSILVDRDGSIAAIDLRGDALVSRVDALVSGAVTRPRPRHR
jgi:thiol-disulfide isomerase/thioredoxin